MGRKKFVHVPPKPGGTVGLLDTFSSVCLFLSVGHFFFTPALLRGLGTWAVVTIAVSVSLGFLALGLYLFARRLRLQPDDGFLAITLFALGRWFGIGRVEARDFTPSADGEPTPPPSPLPETEKGGRPSAPPLRCGEGAGGRGVVPNSPES